MNDIFMNPKLKSIEIKNFLEIMQKETMRHKLKMFHSTYDNCVTIK
jgi:hypothetical protein